MVSRNNFLLNQLSRSFSILIWHLIEQHITKELTLFEQCTIYNFSVFSVYLAGCSSRNVQIEYFCIYLYELICMIPSRWKLRKQSLCHFGIYGHRIETFETLYALGHPQSRYSSNSTCLII